MKLIRLLKAFSFGAYFYTIDIDFKRDIMIMKIIIKITMHTDLIENYDEKCVNQCSEPTIS